MEQVSLLVPLLFAVTGLTIGALLKAVLRNTNFPYTVGLFVTGLLAGLINRSGILDEMPRLTTAIDSVANTNPDFILYVFLPILIFDAAYEMDLHIFKKTLANATLLAAPGLVVAMLLTGVLMMGISLIIPGYEIWTWSFALMFGGLISATDPVAVIALLNELGTSKRFSTLVDAESLLNDGTGIVCFMLFFGAYTASGASGQSPVTMFMAVVAGGALLGFLTARLAVWFITRVTSEEMIQNSVIILSAYITFILSQYYLGVSGVIALVTFGLTVSYTGKPRLKPKVNAFMSKFWNLLSHIANTLIFIIVGVIIAEKVSFSWINLGVLFLIYIGLNLIRFIMIALFYPVMKRLGYGLSKRESVILTWGGLRGALGMTLALMVSYTPAIPEEIRHQILFFTAGIVTLTLAINATTMRWLLNKMGLTQVSSARTLLTGNAHRHLREEAEQYLESLQKKETEEGTDWQEVRQYLPETFPLPTETPATKELVAELRIRILSQEKTLCRRLYAEGTLSKNSFRYLNNSLDELYDHEGHLPLSVCDSIFKYYQRPLISRLSADSSFIRRMISLYFRNRISTAYNLGSGFISLQKEGIKLMNEMETSDMLPDQQKETIRTIKKELESNKLRMEKHIEALARKYPDAYRHALTQKAIRMLLSNERRTVKQMFNEGIISDSETIALNDNTDMRTDKMQSFGHSLSDYFIRALNIKHH